MAKMSTEEYLNQIQQSLFSEMTKKKDVLPPGFNQMRFAMNCVTVIQDMLKEQKKREKLQKVSINSIVMCFMKGAYLGLDFMNQECYAIPYGTEMQFQTDYKGEIKVCKRFSDDPIKDIYAKVVREGDMYDEGVHAGVQQLDFKPVPFSNKPIIGAFAVVIYKDGTIKYDSMSKEEIIHTRDTYSKAVNSQAWKESTGEMYKKTVIRRLSKLIDLNLDKVELIKAYEEGSGFEFENSNSTNRKPAEQLPGAEKVIDVFENKKTEGIEQKPVKATVGSYMEAGTKRPEPVETEVIPPQQNTAPDEQFFIPPEMDNEMPFN